MENLKKDLEFPKEILKVANGYHNSEYSLLNGVEEEYRRLQDILEDKYGCLIDIFPPLDFITLEEYNVY